MKNINKISCFLPLLFIILFFGCNKDENKEFTDWPIIEAYVEPGNFFSVSVTRQIPFSTDVDYSSDDINNLSINVLRNNITYTLTPLGNGKYIDSSMVTADGDNYTLTFLFNSKNVSAYTYIPAKPANLTQSATEIIIEKMDTASGPPNHGSQQEPIKITWDNADGSYYLLVVENMETTLIPIRDFGDKEPPGHRFRKSPSNINMEEIRAMEFQYYGMHRIILYHVLPDYAALYEQNSTSSQNLTNPSTSIVNGYGIFTGLSSDTLYINVKEE